jgi:hypothetical protein
MITFEFKKNYVFITNCLLTKYFEKRKYSILSEAVVQKTPLNAI